VQGSSKSVTKNPVRNAPIGDVTPLILLFMGDAILMESPLEILFRTKNSLLYLVSQLIKLKI
jgi:hypothetical protein